MWDLVEFLKFYWNYEMWLKFWNLVKIEFCPNCEIWLKLWNLVDIWNLVEIVKFSQNGEIVKIVIFWFGLVWFGLKGSEFSTINKWMNYSGRYYGAGRAAKNKCWFWGDCSQCLKNAGFSTHQLQICPKCAFNPVTCPLYPSPLHKFDKCATFIGLL